ncbi:hypothetical protein BCR36DRAFT_403402 [Piromyces finnis]|uniref:RING-type E3 ubiquitin transferase n=1 Tax=Piromyces finnis TaxID=1754191 RepID=A0A1Y1VFX1_9FUNG|nr:hypothetical protein BCR36DRAFT_403402 [Piromyces finnis]|eukprot:ORX54342.1 hypothetical protein BCR36DRAFT_403402 [Piromyces finnis]
MSLECEIFQQEKNIKKKEEKDNEEEKEEDQYTDEITEDCIICFRPLNSTGEHQISSLKCGHVFGKCCIKEWLNTKHKDNQTRCPICGKFASIKEIYPVYSKYMIIDEKELEKEKEDYKAVKRQKLETQKEYNSVIESYNNILQEVKDTKIAIQSYESQLRKLRWNPQQQNYLMKKFSLISTWKISNKRNISKVFTFNNKDNIIYVTKSKSIDEHGVLGINLETNMAVDYINLHKRQIKDLKYNTYKDILLTASMDRTVKLYSANKKNIISSVNVDSPSWSCCWSKKDENKFFVGLSNNQINTYDLRQLNKPLDIISSSNESHIKGKPVHSLFYISKQETKTFNSQLSECYDGILGASLDEIFFCKRNHQPSLVDNTPSDTFFENTNLHANPNEPPTSNIPSYRDNSLSDIASSPLDGKGNMNSDQYHLPSSDNTKFLTTSNKNYSFLSWNEEHTSITSLNYDIHSNQCIVTSRKGTPIANKFATVYTIGYLNYDPDSLFKKRHSIVARNEQNLITKAALYTQLNTDNCYAIVSDVHAKSICIWQISWNDENSLGVHSLCQEIQSYEEGPILDVDVCTIKDSNYLCALNENKLFIHQSN